MRTFTILLFSFFFSCSNGKKIDCNYITDYYPNTAKAEIDFYLGNYEKAYEYYQKAFENCDAIKLGAHHDTDKFAKVCAGLENDKLALYYIEKAIEKGGTLKQFQSDSIFDKILKSPQGQKIIAQYEKKREEYLNSLNIDLRTELQAMIAIDQSLVGNQKARDSIFKINDLRLVEIFEEFGYPNEQVIGNYGIDFINADPTILLLHTDDSIRINYFIPKVKEFIKKGKCPPYVLGTMYDNLALFNGEPQTHGTYENQNGGYANMISDTSEVNKNRAHIGLPNLKMAKKIDSLRR